MGFFRTLRQATCVIALFLLAAMGVAQSFPSTRWGRAGQSFPTNTLGTGATAWSPDGRYAAIGYKNWISIFTVADGFLRYQLPYGGEVGFLPDDSLATYDGTTVRILSSVTYQVSRTMTPSIGGGKFQVEPNGKHLLVNGIVYSSADFSVALAPKGGVVSIIDNDLFLTVDNSNNQVIVMDGRGKIITTLPSDPADRIVPQAVSPKLDGYIWGGPEAILYNFPVGTTAISGTNSGTALKFSDGPNYAWWDWNSFSPNASLVAGTSDGPPDYGVFDRSARNLWTHSPGGGIYNTHFSPDGTQLLVAPSVVGLQVDPVQIDNAVTGAMVTQLSWITTGKWQGSNEDFAASPSGNLVATIANQNDINVWNAKTGARVGVIPQPNVWAYCAAFANDSVLVVGHYSKSGVPSLQAYNVVTGVPIWTSDFGDGWVHSLAIDSRGKGYAAGTDKLVTFDTTSGHITGNFYTASVGNLAVSPDATKIAFVDFTVGDGTLIWTDAAGHVLGQRPTDFSNGISQLSWAADNNRLLESGYNAGTTSKNFFVVDTKTGNAVGGGSSNGGFCLATFAPNSNHIASWHNGRLSFYEATSGQLLFDAPFSLGNVPKRISYSPDESNVSIMGDDGSIVTVVAPIYVSLAKLTLNPSTVTGGTNVTGTVTLTGPAPIGGVSVSLTSISTSTVVPATVVVAAGATTATFSMTTSPVVKNVSATISATMGASKQSASLTVLAPSLVSISVKPTTVPSGLAATGTVTLSGPAPAGGIVASLNSNSNAAIVTPPVKISAGASTATFPIQTFAVNADTAVSLTASIAGSPSKSTTLTVKAAIVIGLLVTPNPIPGGSNATGLVVISAPAPSTGLALAVKSAMTFCTAPTSVVVPSGSSFATFNVSTTPVATTSQGSITFTIDNSMVQPTVLAASLQSLKLNPTSVLGGTSSTGTVTLTSPAPAGGLLINLTSSNSGIASTPSNVSIPAGAKSATFSVTTTAIATNTIVALTATLGKSSAAANLTVQGPSIIGFSIAPNPIVGGSISFGIVMISNPAPAGGVRIALSSGSPTVTVPKTVAIPAGAFFATFVATTSTVTTSTAVNISGLLNGGSSTVTLTVNPH